MAVSASSSSSSSPSKMSIQALLLSLLFFLTIHPSSSSSAAPFTSAFVATSHVGTTNRTTQNNRSSKRYAPPTTIAAFAQRRGSILSKNKNKKNTIAVALSHFPQIAGGAATAKRNNRLAASSDKNNDPNKNTPKQHLTPTKILYTLTSTTLLALLILNRQHLPTPSQIRTHLVSFLDYLASLGTPGLLLYALSLTIWEMTFGITTPVETAAGMAFGIRKGILASASGKLLGAMASFCLGKYFFRSAVHQKLANNEMLELLEDDVIDHPLRTTLIVRFSPLPEFVKNYGLSLLDTLKTRIFVLAVALHGVPFTCLWTCLGNETGLLLRGVVDGPSRTLKVLVSGVTWFGFLVSPTLVGMWVKGLRDKQIKKHQKEDDYPTEDAL